MFHEMDMILEIRICFYRLHLVTVGCSVFKLYKFIMNIKGFDCC